MKRLLLIIILAIFAFGCAQESGLNDPYGSAPDQNQVTASRFDTPPANQPVQCFGENMDYFKSHYNRLVFMNGKTGGTINVKYTYPGGEKLEATLRVEPGSYNGYKLFTIDFDLNNLSVELFPSGEFLIPVHLNLKYKNVDWSKYAGKLNLDNPDFYYIPRNEDAGLEIVGYQFVKYTGKNGDNSLLVQDARLPHFSRFGFVR